MTEAEKANHVHEGMGRRTRKRPARNMSPSDERQSPTKAQRGGNPPLEAHTSLIQPTWSQSLGLQSFNVRSATSQIDHPSFLPPTATQLIVNGATRGNAYEEYDRIAAYNEQTNTELRRLFEAGPNFAEVELDLTPNFVNPADLHIRQSLPTQYNETSTEHEQIATEIRKLMEGEPDVAEDILDTSNIRRNPPVTSGFAGRGLSHQRK